MKSKLAFWVSSWLVVGVPLEGHSVAWVFPEVEGKLVLVRISSCSR
jgi:hypothetical protein